MLVKHAVKRVYETFIYPISPRLERLYPYTTQNGCLCRSSGPAFIWDAYCTLTTLQNCSDKHETDVIDCIKRTCGELPYVHIPHRENAMVLFKEACAKGSVLVIPRGARGCAKVETLAGDEAWRMMADGLCGTDITFVDPDWKWVCMRTHEQYTDMRIGPFFAPAHLRGDTAEMVTCC